MASILLDRIVEMVIKGNVGGRSQGEADIPHGSLVSLILFVISSSGLIS
jgi:hypothetical protein